MSIGREEVRHVARLAELAVKETELDRLVEQLNRIVDYVAQLEQVPGDVTAEPFLPGPHATALREDRPGLGPRSSTLQRISRPSSPKGFFLVPRHGAMEES